MALTPEQAQDIHADLLQALGQINEAIQLIRYEAEQRGISAVSLRDANGRYLLADMINTKVDIIQTLQVMEQEGFIPPNNIIKE